METVIDPAVSSADKEAITKFKSEFSGRLLEPGDLLYDTARKVWNGMIDKYPVLLQAAKTPRMLSIV